VYIQDIPKLSESQTKAIDKALIDIANARSGNIVEDCVHELPVDMWSRMVDSGYLTTVYSDTFREYIIIKS